MDKAPKPEPKKKVYASPVLTVYGTVRDVTKTLGNRRHLDGGTVAGKRRTA